MVFRILCFIAEKQVSEPSQAFDLILQRSPGKLKEFQPRNRCRVSADDPADDPTAVPKCKQHKSAV